MSIMAVTRRPRSRTVVPVIDGAPIPLSHLRPGASAEILGFCADADPSTTRRLTDLGFVPGAEVCMVRRAPMADPVIFRVAGCELALRRVQARCIQVVDVHVAGVRVGTRASA